MDLLSESAMSPYRTEKLRSGVWEKRELEMREEEEGQGKGERGVSREKRLRIKERQAETGSKAEGVKEGCRKVNSLEKTGREDERRGTQKELWNELERERGSTSGGGMRKSHRREPEAWRACPWLGVLKGRQRDLRQLAGT